MTKTAYMNQLREALEASWEADTAYGQVTEAGNPALGQCYPTSRVVQMYFPEAEIVEGAVWTGVKTEKHFWNSVDIHGSSYDIDMTWQQFPHGSRVITQGIRNRQTLNDGPETLHRVELLSARVEQYLAQIAQTSSEERDTRSEP